MDINQENKILESVEEGYDRMAGKFSETRKFFWRDFEFIQKYINDGDNILDFGCGNGRFFEILKNREIKYYGVDVSEKLIEIAKSKYQTENVNFQKISSSGILPFPDNFFKKIVSISVFHHFPGMHAEKMAKELYRTTKPGGEIIISVWNLWQRRYLKYLLCPKFIFRKLFQSGEYKKFGLRDIYIPFKNNQGEIFNRYHHVFSKKELEKIFKKSGFKIGKSFILNQKNLVIIGIKK